MKKVDEALPEFGKPLNAYLTMPSSIKVVLISMCIYILIALTVIFLQNLKGIHNSNMGRMIGNIVIWVVILWGIARRNKAAWWFALVLNLISIMAIFTGALSGGVRIFTLIVTVVLISPVVTATIALALEPSRKYVGMLCPQCKSVRTRGNKYMKTGSVCKDCGYIWG